MRNRPTYLLKKKKKTHPWGFPGSECGAFRGTSEQELIDSHQPRSYKKFFFNLVDVFYHHLPSLAPQTQKDMRAKTDLRELLVFIDQAQISAGVTQLTSGRTQARTKVSSILT